MFCCIFMLHGIYVYNDHHFPESLVLVHDGYLFLYLLFTPLNELGFAGQFDEQFHEVLVPDPVDDGFCRTYQVVAECGFERGRYAVGSCVGHVFQVVFEGKQDAS